MEESMKIIKRYGAFLILNAVFLFISGILINAFDYFYFMQHFEQGTDYSQYHVYYLIFIAALVIFLINAVFKFLLRSEIRNWILIVISILIPMISYGSLVWTANLMF